MSFLSQWGLGKSCSLGCRFFVADTLRFWPLSWLWDRCWQSNGIQWVKTHAALLALSVIQESEVSIRSLRPPSDVQSNVPAPDRMPAAGNFMKLGHLFIHYDRLTWSCQDDTSTTVFFAYGWIGLEHCNRGMLDCKKTPEIEGVTTETTREIGNIRKWVHPHCFHK